MFLEAVGCQFSVAHDFGNLLSFRDLSESSAVQRGDVDNVLISDFLVAIDFPFPMFVFLVIFIVFICLGWTILFGTGFLDRFFVSILVF